MHYKLDIQLNEYLPALIKPFGFKFAPTGIKKYVRWPHKPAKLISKSLELSTKKNWIVGITKITKNMSVKRSMIAILVFIEMIRSKLYRCGSDKN